MSNGRRPGLQPALRKCIAVAIIRTGVDGLVMNRSAL